MEIFSTEQTFSRETIFSLFLFFLTLVAWGEAVGERRKREMPHDGCNMNDKAYPFRGDYRVDREVNHGHSGVWRVVPTSLNVKISGSNLRLETLDAPKSQDLACELGVGNLKPRRVALPQGHQPLEVPSDGKEYQLHATITGPRTKHYCHLTLVGSGGRGDHLRVHVHPSCEPLVAEADGMVLYPQDGFLSLPTLASTCQIRPAAPSSRQSFATTPFCVLQGYDNPLPMIVFPSGEEVPVAPNSSMPIELPAGRGLVQLKLPKLDDPIRPDTRGTPVAPEVDIRVTKEGPQAHLLVTARGSWVELNLDGQPPQTGYHTCIAPFDPRRTCVVHLTVSDPSTQQVQLRQQLLLPASADASRESQPISCRIEDGPGRTRVVFMPTDGFVSVDGQPMIPAERGVSVDCTYPKIVQLTQRYPDGTSSAAQIALPAAKSSDEAWIDDLANILDDQHRPTDQLLAALSNLRPSTTSGQRVVQGVARLLGRPVPNFELRVNGLGTSGAPAVLADLHCKGFNLATAHGSEAPCIIPQGGSLQMDPRLPARLLALDARGTPAAVATVSLGPQATVPASPNADEQLVKSMLDATNASQTPNDLANRLTSIPAQTPNGQQLLPALASMLRKAGPTSNAPHDITLQCNVEQDSNILVSMQIDGNPSQRVPSGQPLPISSAISLLTMKVARKSIASAYEQELIDAYKRTEPRQLSRRWAEQCHPRDLCEEELHPILLALARDLEKALDGHVGERVPAAPATIHFVCGDGQLTNIRSEGYQVSAYVDDMPSLGVGQGGQVPPGVPFSEGTVHRVRIVARDSGGSVRGEVQTTVFGTKGQQSQVGVPYVDASIQQAEEQALRVKLTAPPGFHLSCEIDNKRGESTSGNEAVVLVDARRPHVIGVHVVDSAGCIVFQQKLEIPLMISPSWALQLQNNQLALVPMASDRGFSVTASIDQGPERVFDGTQVRLDHDMPHQLLLRKYFADKSSPCGELLLKFPHFVDPDDTLAAARALQSIPLSGDPAPAFSEIHKIHDRTHSGILRKLLGELLSKMGSIQRLDDDYYRRTTSISPSAAQSNAPVVFFRLRGDEERGPRR